MEKKKSTTESELIELKGFLSFLILHELKKAAQFGDQIASNLGKRKGSKLTAGTIYPTLKRLRKMKLVSYRRNGRRKVYTLTEHGHKEMEKLYLLFGNYFYGLKEKILRKPIKINKKEEFQDK